jgi:methanogenic corrinoid protein MtbC1
LETLELLELAQREFSEVLQETENVPPSNQKLAAGDYYQNCMSAVFSLDPVGLEQIYDQAAVDLTRITLLRDIIVPLFEEIGQLWQSGALKIVNEHMATSVTRNFLMSMLKSTAIPVTAPRIFIATTTGQWHELGALAVALTAAEYGWQPIYFGPNLPAEEIAAGVKQSDASAVALSITHLLDPYSLKDELYKLRKYVGQNVALIVGGSPAVNQLNILEEINATYIMSIDQLRDELNVMLAANVE